MDLMIIGIGLALLVIVTIFILGFNKEQERVDGIIHRKMGASRQQQEEIEIAQKTVVQKEQSPTFLKVLEEVEKQRSETQAALEFEAQRNREEQHKKRKLEEEQQKRELEAQRRRNELLRRERQSHDSGSIKPVNNESAYAVHIEPEPSYSYSSDSSCSDSSSSYDSGSSSSSYDSGSSSYSSCD